jgi:hypothetical protein
MPTATENTAPATTTVNIDASAVFDTSMRSGTTPTIQALADAGLFKSDDARTKVLLAKRLNRLKNGIFSKGSEEAGLGEATFNQITNLQRDFRADLANNSFEHLLESGKLNAALESYTQFLIARSQEKLQRLTSGKLTADEANPAALMQLIGREQKKLEMLQGEHDTYRGSPDFTRQMLRDVKDLVTSDKYMTTSELVKQSGLVEGSQDRVADMVSDVQALVEARRIKLLARQFRMVDNIAANPDSPEARVRSLAVSMAARQATQPLAALHEFEAEGTDRDRVVALKLLLEAQIHEAFSQPRSHDQLVQLEKDTGKLAHTYAQVALSLAHHYLESGAAAGDPRVQKMKENVKAEIAREELQLMPPDQAIAEAAKLARASAQDLLLAAQGNEANVEMVRKLATAAGVAEAQSLTPDSQLVAKVISEGDTHHIVATQYLQRLLQERQASEQQTATVARN